jgi:hypothetical protein
MELDAAQCNGAWTAYLREFAPLWRKTRDLDFIRKGYVVGHLPVELAQRTAELIRSTPHAPFVNEDCDADALGSRQSADTLAAMNREHVFFQATGSLRWAFFDVLENLAEPVAAALGSPWRLITIRTWATHASNAAIGPNAWHGDGMSPELFKVMVYLTEIGGEKGGIEVRSFDGGHMSLSGPPGTWMLFFNSDLPHCAIAPKQAGLLRIAIEVTLAPWPVMSLKPRFLGQNARCPLLPVVVNEERI